MEVMILDVYRDKRTLLIACLACEEKEDGSLVATSKVISMSLRLDRLPADNPFAAGFVEQCWRELDVLATPECLAALDSERIAVVEALRGRIAIRPALDASMRRRIDDALQDRPPEPRGSD